jgi:hypothetical protein
MIFVEVSHFQSWQVKIFEAQVAGVLQLMEVEG